MKDKKKLVWMTIGIISIVLVIVLTIVYVFNYSMHNLKVGNVIIHNYSNSISFSNALPNNIDVNNDNSMINITFDGKTNDKTLEYLVKLTKTSFAFEEEFPFNLIFTITGLGESDINYFDNREKESSIYKVLFEDTFYNDENLIIGTISPNKENIKGSITIKAMLKDSKQKEENVNIGELSFKVEVEAKEGIWFEEPASVTLKKRVNTVTSCVSTSLENNVIQFGGKGEIVYFNGNEECVDYNYVWYSGKLWRVVAIYPNGIIKMVTENPMTSIGFGEDVLFNKSYINQWLLEEFLATLYNHNKIIVNNALWNISSTDAITNPYTRENAIVIKRPIGLLNAYEYQKTVSDSNSFLDIGQFWWLADAYNNSYVRGVNAEGELIGNLPSKTSLSVRPAIYLKRSVSFTNMSDTDAGKRNNPYRISVDYENAKMGEFVNNRQIGEYVSLDNNIYRIVGFEGEGTYKITKVVSVDYVENKNSQNNDKLLSSFGEDRYFNTQSDNEMYWDNYLKKNWLNESDMLTEGTYYLGSFSSGDYRKTLCKEGFTNQESISNCDKFDEENLIYKGLVGLLRVGEMFAAQQSFLEHVKTSNAYKPMWLITPYLEGESSVCRVNNNGIVDSTSIIGNFNAVRPTIYLNSDVIINSGNGMMNDPYVLIKQR